MSKITVDEVKDLMEAYSSVYNESEFTEDETWEQVEKWVNNLVDEGYDLSDYSWSDMYEEYLNEIAVNMGGKKQLEKQQKDKEFRSKVDKLRQQRFGGSKKSTGSSVDILSRNPITSGIEKYKSAGPRDVKGRPLNNLFAKTKPSDTAKEPPSTKGGTTTKAPPAPSAKPSAPVKEAPKASPAPSAKPSAAPAVKTSPTAKASPAPSAKPSAPVKATPAPKGSSDVKSSAKASTAEKISKGMNVWKQQKSAGDMKGATETGKSIWALKNPKLAASAAERERTRGTKQTDNPLMSGMKSKLPDAPKGPDVVAKTKEIASKPVQPTVEPPKTKSPRELRLNMEMEHDAYNVVLEYLFSQGHVDTLDEAHYVMMEMTAETIQSICEDK